MIRSGATDSFLSTQLPVLDMVAFDEYSKHEDAIPKLFNVKSSDKWGEQYSTMAGLKAAVLKPEGTSVTFDDPIQGYDTTFTHSTYALAVAFSEELIEDDKMQIVEDTYRSMGLSMYQTRQIEAMGVFNDGFTNTGMDGENLFDVGHPLPGGGTYQNRPTTDIALSVAGLREMEVEMGNQVNGRNINVMVRPRMVLVPWDLNATALELLRSVDRPDTANRAINSFYSTNYELCVSPFLSSTTAWFALADKGTHKLVFHERIAPQIKSWPEERTGSINTRIRSRFSVGYYNWVGAWGTTG